MSKEGIPIDDQILQSMGIAMEDLKTLLDYNILNEDTI